MILESEIEAADDEVEKRISQGFLNLAFGDENILDRNDFVDVVMSKRCNWIFDQKAIKNRFDIQMSY